MVGLNPLLTCGTGADPPSRVAWAILPSQDMDYGHRCLNLCTTTKGLGIEPWIPLLKDLMTRTIRG
jgi:hypothetical protein